VTPSTWASAWRASPAPRPETRSWTAPSTTSFADDPSGGRDLACPPPGEVGRGR
jgi:hypothetical protein